MLLPLLKVYYLIRYLSQPCAFGTSIELLAKSRQYTIYSIFYFSWKRCHFIEIQRGSYTYLLLVFWEHWKCVLSRFLRRFIIRTTLEWPSKSRIKNSIKPHQYILRLFITMMTDARFYNILKFFFNKDIFEYAQIFDIEGHSNITSILFWVYVADRRYHVERERVPRNSHEPLTFYWRVFCW